MAAFVVLSQQDENPGRPKEVLELRLTQADVSRVLFRLETDLELWAALIGRARVGDITGERVEAASFTARE